MAGESREIQKGVGAGFLMRLFIGVHLSNQILNEIEKIHNNKHAKNLNIKWIKLENLHITLKFLGNVDENRVSEISETLKNTCKNFQKFNVTVKSIIPVKSIRHLRMIWAGIENASYITKIANELETNLEPLGFPKEEREYKAHINLSRIKKRINPDNLKPFFKEVEDYVLGEMEINRIVLFESQLLVTGAKYKELQSVEL